MKPFIGQLPNLTHPNYQGVVCDLIFNEGQGSRVFDGYSKKIGTLNNFPTGAWRSRSSGNFLEFDGTNDNVTIPFHDRLAFTQGLTLVAHMYVSSTSSDKGVASQSSAGSGTDGWWISIRDPSDSRPNAIQFALNDSDFFSNNNAVPTNQWFWLAVVWDGATVFFYIDGILVSSTTTSGNTIVNNAATLRIGREYNFYTTSGYLDGGMSFFRMLNYGITASEVRRIMAEPYVAYHDSPGFRYGHIAAAGATIPVFVNHYRNQGIM